MFIVSEMTVPGLKHAKHIVAAIRERMPDGPQPQVIINRFEQRMFVPGLKKSDLDQALGNDFAAAIPNHYRLVREAIDRGVPLEEVKRRQQDHAGIAQADCAAAGQSRVKGAVPSRRNSTSPSHADRRAET